MSQSVILVAVLIVASCVLIIGWVRNSRSERLVKEHSISPDGLRSLMESKHDVQIFDVRQPLDLLANSEIIPGATRIPPKEVIANPALLPRNEDAVIYCTCPSDKTSKVVLQHLRSAGFSHIKFLRGGLEAWKRNGYPVAPYEQSFRLDTR